MFPVCWPGMKFLKNDEIFRLPQVFCPVLWWVAFHKKGTFWNSTVFLDFLHRLLILRPSGINSCLVVFECVLCNQLFVCQSWGMQYLRGQLLFCWRDFSCIVVTRFLEGQASLRSHDSAPRPPSSISKLSLFVNLPVCHRSSLRTEKGEGREQRGAK